MGQMLLLNSTEQLKNRDRWMILLDCCCSFHQGNDAPSMALSRFESFFNESVISDTNLIEIIEDRNVEKPYPKPHA